MSLFKTTVMAVTATGGGMLGKSIGAKVLGSAILGTVPLAALGAYAGYKLVNIGNHSHVEAHVKKVAKTAVG